MVSLVILAAGSGKRMNSEINKVFLNLCGKTVLAHTLSAFNGIKEITNCVIVCRKGEEGLARKDAENCLKIPFCIVTGGSERQYSVKNAFNALPNDVRYICVHDAARCLVKREIIENCIKSARRFGSGCAGIPVKDTLKQTEGSLITSTVDRNSLAAIQTPQVFKKELLLRAHQKAQEEGFLGTDESVLVERLGEKVHMVLSDAQNIKITTVDDLKYAEFLLQGRQNFSFRIGHGYDAHRFAAGRKLILGGIEIPFEKGLLGHSDADVLIHAVTDALLGAGGFRDIGYYFPPSDDTYKDADSLKLLEKVGNMLEEKGFEVANIDATLILEAPKVAEHTGKMCQKIANALSLPDTKVNVKATTTEGMGFTGTGEGAAAQAVCLLTF